MKLTHLLHFLYLRKLDLRIGLFKIYFDWREGEMVKMARRIDGNNGLWGEYKWNYMKHYLTFKLNYWGAKKGFQN